MAATTTTRLMTSDELAAMPDDGRRYELIEGVLVSMPPGFPEPGAIAMRLVLRLGVFVEPQALGTIFGPDTGFRFDIDPDTVRAPDVAFLRRDRLPPRAEWQRYFEIPPDLAVEVRSSSDRIGELRDKMRFYLEHGVALGWLVDPQRGVVEVYEPGRERRTLQADDVLDGGAVLSGFTLSVAEIFNW